MNVLTKITKWRVHDADQVVSSQNMSTNSKCLIPLFTFLYQISSLYATVRDLSRESNAVALHSKEILKAFFHSERVNIPYL